jgi:hypothetical protein
MFTDRLQTRRFELKYHVGERTAHAIRRVLRLHLEPDDYGASPELPVYSVHSLYLDSADYALCRATLHGERNRFKLRVRYYDDHALAPVSLEIKRREDRCIRKRRAFVRRDAVAELIAGKAPDAAQLASPSPRGLDDLMAFCDLVRRVDARPSAHIAYEREAWLSAGDGAVRVTFDRSVRCEPVTSPRLHTAFTAPTPVFAGGVVLEIKFTDRFPAWLHDLVSRFSLRQESAAKYADGLACSGAVIGRHRAPAASARTALGDIAGFIGAPG